MTTASLLKNQKTRLVVEFLSTVGKFYDNLIGTHHAQRVYTHPINVHELKNIGAIFLLPENFTAEQLQRYNEPTNAIECAQQNAQILNEYICGLVDPIEQQKCNKILAANAEKLFHLFCELQGNYKIICSEFT